MKKFAAKISMGLAAAALAATIFAPAAFAKTKVVVSGNGAHSDTDVTLKNKNTSLVTQSNSTAVFTLVVNASNTGGNKIKNNVGDPGVDPSITSGDVKNKTNVTVNGNSNTATPPAPCGCDTDTTVKVTGNGAYSDNDVKIVNSNSTTVSQSNKIIVGTAVVNLSNTGGNTINGNVGGDNTITSGNVKNTTTVNVDGGTNTI